MCPQTGATCGHPLSDDISPKGTTMDQYLAVLKKYAQFDGRARRKEFWMFVLFNVLVSVGLSVVDTIVTNRIVGFPLLGTIYSLAVLVPSIAVGVRRLHDTGRSGWFILIGLIPCIGVIILIVFYAEEGKSGSNQDGTDPKAGERDALAG